MNKHKIGGVNITITFKQTWWRRALGMKPPSPTIDTFMVKSTIDDEPFEKTFIRNGKEQEDE